MKNTKKNRENTNLASEFFVASQLIRLGYIVTITIGPHKEIDLIVMTPDEKKTFTIDVKGIKNKSNWPISVKKDKNHFYILVSYGNRFDEINTFPEVFIIPSIDIEEGKDLNEGKLLTPWTGRPNVKCIAYRNPTLKKYKDNWECLPHI